MCLKSSVTEHVLYKKMVSGSILASLSNVGKWDLPETCRVTVSINLVRWTRALTWQHMSRILSSASVVGAPSGNGRGILVVQGILEENILSVNIAPNDRRATCSPMSINAWGW